MELYRKEAERLLREGRPYRCVCTKEELDGGARDGRPESEKPRYDGRCRTKSTRGDGGEARRPPFQGPEDRADGGARPAAGRRRLRERGLDDLVLLRRTGRQRTNFVVVIDDASMAITDVLRGDDHSNNTPKQLLLYEALGYPSPGSATPADPRDGGGKLSKRQDTSP